MESPEAIKSVVLRKVSLCAAICSVLAAAIPLEVVHPQVDAGVFVASQTDSLVNRGVVTITLRGGRTIIGTVVYQTPDTLQMKSDSKMYVIPTSQIANITVNESATLTRKQKSTTGFRSSPVGSGSLIISSTLLFSRTSFDRDDAFTNTSFNASSTLFFVRGIGFGMDFGYSNISLGRSSLSAMHIGPHLVFGFGSGVVFPILRVGYSHVDYGVEDSFWPSVNSSGAAFKLSVGMINRIWNSIGIPVEASVTFLSHGGRSVTVFGLSFGVSGFLFDLFQSMEP